VTYLTAKGIPLADQYINSYFLRWLHAIYDALISLTIHIDISNIRSLIYIKDTTAIFSLITKYVRHLTFIRHLRNFFKFPKRPKHYLLLTRVFSLLETCVHINLEDYDLYPLTRVFIYIFHTLTFNFSIVIIRLAAKSIPWLFTFDCSYLKVKTAEKTLNHIPIYPTKVFPSSYSESEQLTRIRWPQSL
jgi:hypothetical protein